MWLKLDDNFHSHPKVLAAGRDARDLYVAGLAYAAKHLTDGVIPEGAVATLAVMAGAEVDGPAAAARLVEVGLWEEGAGGYQVHDYHDYNPSGAEVRERLAHRSAGGKARAAFARRLAGRFTAAEPPADDQQAAGECWTSSAPAGPPAPRGRDPDPDPDPVVHANPNGLARVGFKPNPEVRGSGGKETARARKSRGPPIRGGADREARR